MVIKLLLVFKETKTFLFVIMQEMYVTKKNPQFFPKFFIFLNTFPFKKKVTYVVDNFLDKNGDTLFDDLKTLCLNSRLPLLQNIFQLAGDIVNVGGKGGNKARPVTAGYQFQKSVSELLKAFCMLVNLITFEPSNQMTKNEDFILMILV